MKKELIQLQHISKSFDGQLIIDDLNLSIYENSFVTLLGPSGCGKTTILRIIGGFEHPDQGRVIFDGKDITDLAPNKRQLNTVFQKYALFSHLDVAENIAFGLKIKNKPAAYIKDKIQYALKLVNLEGFEHRMPDSLSGGQQQRIAIARALAMKPKYMLFDEPTSALDPELIGEVLKVIRQLADDGMTMIIVTHEMSFARDIADRIIMLDGGVIIEEGPPEQFFTHPKQERTREFLRSIIDREKATQEKLLSAADEIADFIGGAKEEKHADD